MHTEPQLSVYCLEFHSSAVKTLRGGWAPLGEYLSHISDLRWPLESLESLEPVSQVSFFNRKQTHVTQLPQPRPVTRTDPILIILPPPPHQRQRQMSSGYVYSNQDNYSLNKVASVWVPIIQCASSEVITLLTSS